MKNLLLCAVTVFILSSCGSIAGLESRIRKLEIGMTKKEVLNTISKDYTPISSVKTPDGVLETIRFYGLNTNPYIVTFLDNELVEWYVEEPRPTAQPVQIQNVNANP